MSRNGGGTPGDPKTGRGWKSASGLALALLAGSNARGGDGDPPDLAPPAEMPAASKPGVKPPITSTPSRPNRAILAIPGLMTPVSRPTISPPAEHPNPALDPGPGELSLEAPIEMRPRVEPPSTTNSAASRSPRPLALELSPLDEPLPGPSTSRPKPTPNRSAIVPQPARRPRLFGFRPGAAPMVAPGATAALGRATAGSPGEESSPESTLKRRIERQAREVVGSRGRSVEVEVEGKRAIVRVGGVKLFQKRGVRKQLEGIPALSGLRSTIVVDD